MRPPHHPLPLKNAGGEQLHKADREKVKQASRELLSEIQARLAELDRFWEKEQTKGEVKTFILNEIYWKLPTPPYTQEEKELVADSIYGHVWQQAVGNAWQGARPQA